MSEHPQPEKHNTHVEKKDTTDPKLNPAVDELSEIETEQVAGGLAAIETVTVGVTASWAR